MYVCHTHAQCQHKPAAEGSCFPGVPDGSRELSCVLGNCTPGLWDSSDISSDNCWTISPVPSKIHLRQSNRFCLWLLYWRHEDKTSELSKQTLMTLKKSHVKQATGKCLQFHHFRDRAIRITPSSRLASSLYLVKFKLTKDTQPNLAPNQQNSAI